MSDTKYPIQITINGELALYGEFTSGKLDLITKELFKLGLNDAYKVVQND